MIQQHTLDDMQCCRASFQCLQKSSKVLRFSPETSCAITVVCAMLHNTAVNAGIHLHEEEDEEEDD